MPKAATKTTAKKNAAAPSKHKAARRAPRAGKARPARAAPDATTAARQAKPARDTRKSAILALISRKGGATLQEIMTTVGWQAHSVRGFIATLGSKHGMKISSTKNADGERTYAA